MEEKRNMNLAKEVRELRKSHYSKAYFGNWHVKLLHQCPTCGRAKGWRGMNGQRLRCLNCGHVITWEEWMSDEFPRKARLMYLGAE